MSTQRRGCIICTCKKTELLAIYNSKRDIKELLGPEVGHVCIYLVPTVDDIRTHSLTHIYVLYFSQPWKDPGSHDKKRPHTSK